jgi:hypothetical protein
MTPHHFSADAIHAFDVFQSMNPLGMDIEVWTSPGDSDIVSLRHRGNGYLTVMPVEGGFELSFESGDSDSYISGPFAMELFKWPSWIHTYATLKDTLQKAEEFISGLVKRRDDINAYVVGWSGNDGGDGGLRLAA